MIINESGWTSKSSAEAVNSSESTHNSIGKLDYDILKRHTCLEFNGDIV